MELADNVTSKLLVHYVQTMQKNVKQYALTMEKNVSNKFIITIFG